MSNYKTESVIPSSGKEPECLDSAVHNLRIVACRDTCVVRSAAVNEMKLRRVQVSKLKKSEMAVLIKHIGQ